MDKNTGIGLVLIAAIVIGFSLLTKPSQEEIEQQQRYQDSIASIQASQIKEDIESGTNAQSRSQSEVADFFDVQASQTITVDSTGTVVDSISISETIAQVEQIEVLENEKLKIEISTLGGQIKSVWLKDYKTYAGDSLYLTNSDGYLSLELMNKKAGRLDTQNAIFKALRDDSNDQTLVMRLSYSDKQYIDFIYALAPNDYMLNFDFAVVGMDNILSIDGMENFTLKWGQDLRRQEKNLKNEQHYSKLNYRTIDGSFEGLSESGSENKEVTSNTKWIAFKDQYFASTLIAEESFKNAYLETKMIESDDYLKKLSANLTFRPEQKANGALTGSFKFFYGPLDYYMLKGYDEGVKESSKELDLDELIPLGWTIFRVVNKYFIIPLFDLLNSTGMQVGLVIFFLTLIIKIILAPLTYKSFMSSAKMRALKPEVDEINEKYPGQDKAMEKQKATMQLYNEAGVNPMSGCIPMVLQMPILIALFQFFPSAIELRQQSFLWATDLSTYDAILEWNTNIPLISGWLGNHISLFCVLMTVTNIIYTKFNMDATNTGQQQMPGMKWMMMFMPLIFFFVLNNYPAGLNYYYFLSTLMTILITLGFRYFVDEKKVLAQLEENKKKPKKKGFMARLQEQAEQAQRQQQQANKGKGKGKRR